MVQKKLKWLKVKPLTLIPAVRILEITVNDGDGVAVTGATVTVETHIPTGTVTGTLVDNDGNPIADKTIALLIEDLDILPQDTEDIPFGTSQNDGSFDLMINYDSYDIPYGDYYLTAWEYDHDMKKLGSQNVTIDEAEENFTFTIGGA